MLVVKNKFFPLLPYTAIMILGILFVRSEVPITKQLLNHERIHVRQMLELLIIPFYVWYLIEFLIKLVKYRSMGKAYSNIGFERESYVNGGDLNYIKYRRIFSFTEYI